MTRSTASKSARPSSSASACAGSAGCFPPESLPVAFLAPHATIRPATMVQPNLRIRELFHREFTIEHDVEGERLGLGARFDVLGNAAEPVGNSRDLFLGEPSHLPQAGQRFDSPVLDLLLHNPQVVSWTVNPGSPNHIRDFPEAWHRMARHLDTRHDERGRVQGL